MALFFIHYNFCHVHGALGQTPAMSEGFEDRQWNAMT